MIWLTSDLHLGHKTAVAMNQRPFADTEEMNEILIKNYNRLVGARDTVYILGDLTCRISSEEANQLISRLKGKKILVKGNHDRKYDPSLFEEICDYRKLRFQHCKFILMHYPLQEWDGDTHFSIHLHGHIHSRGRYNQVNLETGLRRYDVGVDANGFCPVSLDWLIEKFKNLLYTVKIDRHNYDEGGKI